MFKTDTEDITDLGDRNYSVSSSWFTKGTNNETLFLPIGGLIN